ncbi:O-antigen ligase family protein [Eggerthella guodeyinii]|uniref:O-antigen ligase family protein n=1 Tax=Eggerthella guodeyinii TaxID=2690837 RepID=A0A6L7IYS8_9ACTN|nr:O-antigen ligase family protein [Eggerthella guodeyinii]QOS67600.1 O-antigen ligase family protein [Eggerthella guodeyinii]
MQNEQALPGKKSSNLRIRGIVRQNSKEVAEGKDKKDSGGGVLVWLCVGFLAFFIPAEYAVSPALYTLWKALIVLVSSVSLVYLLARLRISLRWVCFALFYLCLLVVSTLVSPESSTSLSNVAYLFVKGAGFITFLECAFSFGPKLCTKAFLVVGVVVGCVHLASFFAYGDVVGGMRHGWIEEAIGERSGTKQNWYFLTYDNASVFFFLPVIAALWFYVKNFNRRVVLVFVPFAVVTVFMFVYKSSIAGMLAFASFFLIAYLSAVFSSNRRAKKRILTYRIAVISGLVISCFVIFSVGGDIVEAVAGLFGKGADLSGRDYIWAQCLNYISKYPIIGSGVQNSADAFLRIGQTHCHNLLLQIMYTGGIVSLLFFLIGVATCSPKAKRNRDKQDSPFSGQLFAAAILAFFIASSVDWSYNNPMSFILFYFAFFCSFDLEDSRIDGGN